MSRLGRLFDRDLVAAVSKLQPGPVLRSRVEVDGEALVVVLVGEGGEETRYQVGTDQRVRREQK